MIVWIVYKWFTTIWVENTEPIRFFFGFFSSVELLTEIIGIVGALVLIFLHKYEEKIF